MSRENMYSVSVRNNSQSDRPTRVTLEQNWQIFWNLTVRESANFEFRTGWNFVIFNTRIMLYKRVIAACIAVL